MTAHHSIYDTKTHFSKLIKDVKQGHSVIITDRGNPVAKLVPYVLEETFEERISRFREMGVISNLSDRPKKKIRPKCKKTGAVKEFLAERE